MLAVVIPEKVYCESFFAEVNTLIENGVRGIEVSIYRTMNNQLMVCLNHLSPIYLSDILSYIVRQKLDLILVLNFIEPYLEVFAMSLVKKFHLENQVRYTGEIMPEYLSLRERNLIHYDVETCLPNYYYLSTIKRSHLDVIHYFMTKNKVSILRLHVSGLTENVLEWANELGIKLSIYGVTTSLQAETLLANGIGFVSASADNIFGHLLDKHIDDD